MTKPRNYQTEAIIIRKTKLGEADRILTLYTPHLGNCVPQTAFSMCLSVYVPVSVDAKARLGDDGD